MYPRRLAEAESEILSDARARQTFLRGVSKKRGPRRWRCVALVEGIVRWKEAIPIPIASNDFLCRALQRQV